MNSLGKPVSEQNFWNFVTTSTLLTEATRQEILADRAAYYHTTWYYIKRHPSVFGQEIAGELVGLAPEQAVPNFVLVSPLSDANGSESRFVFVLETDLVATLEDESMDLFSLLAVPYLSEQLRKIYAAMIVREIGNVLSEMLLVELLMSALGADEATAKQIVEDDAVNPHRLGYYLVKQQPDGEVAKTITGELIVIDSIDPKKKTASVYLVKDFMASGRVTKTVALSDLTNNPAA